MVRRGLLGAVSSLQHPGLQRSIELKQYTSIHFRETPFLERLVPSIGSVGDAYNNALAETAIGRFKTECYRIGSQCLPRQARTLAELKDAVPA
jgi:putative transposase